MFPEIDFKLTAGSGRLILVGILFLFGIAITCRTYFGRRAVPAVPNRKFLFILRGLSVLLISLVLLGPVLQVRQTRMVRPSFSILVDRSLSMDFPFRESEGELRSRIESVRDHFHREALIETLRSKADVRTFIFSDHAIPVDPDSIFGSRDGLLTGRTDIVAALRDCQRMNPGASRVIVVTDGRINHGEDLREYRSGDARLLFLGVGEETGSPDLDLAGIEIAPRVYEGSPVPVTVSLRARTGNPDTVSLSITEGDMPIETAVLALEAGEYHRDVSIAIPALPPGRHVIPLTVEGVEQEPYLGNNRRHLILEVLPSVKRTLVISTTPRWDLSFLVKTLRELEGLSVDLYLLKPGSGGGVFVTHEDEILEEIPAKDRGTVPYDLLCIQGDMADPRLQALSDLMRSFPEPGKGILLLVTEGIDRSRQEKSPFLSLLPATLPESFEIVSGRYDIVPPLDDHTGLTRLSPDLNQSLTYWSSLPPMTGLMKTLAGNTKEVTKPATLLFSKDERDQEVPVVMIEDRQGFRIVSLLGRGFWRWSFHRSLSGGFGAGYRNFLDALTRWAFEGLRAGEIRMMPVSNYVRQGEPIQFRVVGSGVDEDILVTIEPVESNAPPDTFLYRFLETRETPEILTIPPHQPGDYRYTYRLRGREIAGRGNVYVDTYSMEFSRPEPDNRFLQEAMLTATGEYVDLFKVNNNNLTIYAPLEKVDKIYLINIVINSQPLVFVVILILLIVELYLRKSAGFS